VAYGLNGHCLEWSRVRKSRETSIFKAV